ncbi:MAG: phosphodiesterase [Bacilli bacterium]
MKVLIASDIHGSLYYAQKLMQVFDVENCDTLILLGDILYHGPRNDLPKEYNPKRVITLLNQYADKIIAIKGNCDAEVDQMVLDFLLYDDVKKIEINNKIIYLTHGHRFNPSNTPSYVKSGDYFIYGHTHVPLRETINGITYLNPGSISIPKNNSHHSVIILEGEEFRFVNLENY